MKTGSAPWAVSPEGKGLVGVVENEGAPQHKKFEVKEPVEGVLEQSG